MKRLLMVLGLVFGLLFTASPAQAHHYVGHSKGGKPKPPATTTVNVLQIHNEVCPKVVEYLDCSTLSVTVANFGATGWTGSAGPANKMVQYNTYYTLSAASWEQTVAHEVGGHHDAWAEVSARGVNPWEDYYDLDTFAWNWLSAKGYSYYRSDGTKNQNLSKEIYLDCVGPVAHGYSGNYLTSRGVPSSVCVDNSVVMDQALAGTLRF